MKEVDLRPIRDCKGSASGEENKIYFAKSANNQHENSFLGLVIGDYLGEIAEFFLSLSMSDGRGCRAYIFVWIFFDESSGLKNLAVLNHKEVGNKIFTLGVYIDKIEWLGLCDIFPAWVFALLILVVGSQGLELGISECVACAFFMDLSGNKELLEGHLVAFFASRTSPPEALALSEEWAHAIAQTDKIVISGFHSPIERAVLDVLLNHRHPVIVALGRSLYRRIPLHLQRAHDEGRLLFLTFRDHLRTSFTTSQQRNWVVADLASELIFAPFEPSSQLSTLYFTHSRGVTPCRILGE